MLCLPFAHTYAMLYRCVVGSRGEWNKRNWESTRETERYARRGNVRSVIARGAIIIIIIERVSLSLSNDSNDN